MSHQPADSAGSGKASVSYQWGLTALLSLNFGFVLFDRNALNFLMPFVQPELHLDNSHIGMLSSGLSLTWAVAAFGVGYVADKFGSRKRLLVFATLLFALCSFGSGVAAGFAAMLGTRLVMGVAEGGIMPLSQSLIAAQVDARRHGLAMGIAQGFGSSLMGSFVAPVALVWIAEHWGGWRHAFFLAGAPGLLIAVLIAMLVKEAPSGVAQSPPRPERPRATSDSLVAVLLDGNVLRCLILSIAFVGYLVVTWTFMPLYLVQVRHIDASAMSWLMGVLGIAATLFSFAITGLSDRIGRRLSMIIAPLLALILPLGTLYLHGPTWMLAVVFFVGWTFTGIMPLFMATVPAESVDPRHIGVALGLCMGGSEILGGVLAPYVSGNLADRYGQQAPLWVLLVLALVGIAASLGLRETAPRLLSRAP